ncbi:1-deoxy-D-xylulose-5-phosphate reductoisomerase [Microbacter margulisiae]|uniref:1-deoxy-D-xylulose 5-phosphate reductoisomerase n=1 Tax=Microbacter margulisiae TaxID=1350067 RepID=A0A7W5H246_9PORP|nr:1-deoxy-D-xylulose-5-phosphate reductoisomerase [Microbacter margulisiae]MBB3187037.1 1-deoxy-D-xylulose-5-phosphate reductoisomerase [Microbacter margulisiae]
MIYNTNRSQPKQIALLGSTGSIGTQALEVISAHPENFEVYALTANNNVDLLIQQARHFLPAVVAIANPVHYFKLKDALSDLPIHVYSGIESIAQIAAMEAVDIALTAMVGYAGLLPTLSAVKSGKTIALANKETLVVAGELIYSLVKQHHAAIIPVDSEHSAIFQCLVGEGDNPVEKIFLTASGGPFRTTHEDDLSKVTKNEALQHPNWNMGAKITIDSATMMNKGFEVIEAKWLFGLESSQIEVLVHPQSIVHSMAEFADGSIKAQLGLPDMRLPIQYAFSYPNRFPSKWPRLDFTAYPELTFEKPDLHKFRNLALAFEVIKQQGNAPCVLNAANEVVVAAFLRDEIGFLQMSDVIEATLQKVTFLAKPSYEDYVTSDEEARCVAAELVGSVCNM